MSRRCQIDDCRREAHKQSPYCPKHRTRINRHGDPHFTEWGTADEYDVELIVRERRPVDGLTRLERVLVARGLTARGASEAEIAEIVRVDPRTVRRWRSADRQSTPAA
jgi:hypothetical protein